MSDLGPDHDHALQVAARAAVEALGTTRIALAESCTGGLAAAALTRVPGSSACLVAGIAASATEAKTALLGVPAELISAHGAVSAPVVLAMAAGARERCGVTAAGALSGVAGPGGGSPGKPVGTVWFAVDGPAGPQVWTDRFEGDRDAVRAQAAAALLRRIAELR